MSMRTIEKLLSERNDFTKDVQENKKVNRLMLEKALRDIKQFKISISIRTKLRQMT